MVATPDLADFSSGSFHASIRMGRGEPEKTTSPRLFGMLGIASDHLLENAQAYYLTYPQAATDLPALQRFRDWLRAELEKAST